MIFRGSVDIFGEISYAPQESWVFSGKKKIYSINFVKIIKKNFEIVY